MWKKTDDDNGWASWVGSGVLANNHRSGNAAQMRLGMSVNGSGKKAFGGAKQWPNLTLEIGFQVGEEAYRDALALELRRTTEKFFARMDKGVRS